MSGNSISLMSQEKQDASQQNPLLTQQLPIAFKTIEAKHVEPAIAALLPEMNARIDALGSGKMLPTYRDVLLALDSATEPLDFAISVTRHLESVVTTPEFRAAHNAVQEPVSAFYTSIPLHAGLWKAVKAVEASDEAAHLAPVYKRHLEKSIRGFVRSGADLDEEGKRKLESLNIEFWILLTRLNC